MYVVAHTLDDLMRRVFAKLLAGKGRVKPTKGETVEEIGVLLKLTNPRSRISRTESKGTIFSCLGEFLWYLAGSDKLDFIQYYLRDYDRFSDDKITLWGAYGPRLFSNKGQNQICNIINLLKRNPPSRRAVIQLFDALDISEESQGKTRHEDVPCTCTLQFIRRSGKLHMFSSMRSNDAYMGMPHDIFSFTMLQELVAGSLNIPLGSYYHSVGSLHLYEKHRSKANAYINEGWQPTVAMPPMPPGDQWPTVDRVLAAEKLIRKGGTLDVRRLGLDGYWVDLIRLLIIFQARKICGDARIIGRQKKQMNSKIFNTYIERRHRLNSRAPESQQLPIVFLSDS